jgi:hypothetical protein
MQLYIKSRYKGYKEIRYETVKLVDAIDFLESDKLKKWLKLNQYKQTKINPSLNYGQAYEIFYSSMKSRLKRGEEFEDSAGFKNFKKLWGKQIKFIDA